VDGRLSPHGLAMYPARPNGSASVTYRLGRHFLRLEGGAGIDDNCYNRGKLRTETPLTFMVRGDGKELWRSRPIQHAGESQDVGSLDLSGVDKLELVVDCPGSNM